MTATTTEYREYLSTQEQQRRGRKTGDSVYLRPEAHAAVTVGLDRLGCRIDPTRKSRINAAKMAALDPSSTLGQLVTAALAWADAEPVKDMAAITEAYRLAVAMRDMQDQIDPQPERAPLTAQAADTCSHGVKFSDVCAHCEP